MAGAVTARLEAPPAALSVAREALAVDDPAAEYAASFRTGRWDGKVWFVRPDGSFPAGLTWRVAAALDAAGFGRPDIAWPAPRAGLPLAPPMDIIWRPYQADAVEKAVRARRMALQCPTRGGKTEIALEFARRVGGRTLWVTHLRELLRQTSDRVRSRLGLDPDGGPVTVAMIQTLHNMLGSGRAYFEQFETLVMDEGHHAGADTWQAVARACSRATYRLALSGTMATGNPVSDMRIEGAFGPTYVVATTSGLADLGFVARPRVVVLRPRPETYPTYEEVRAAVCPEWRVDPTQLSRLGGELYREAYRRGITENAERNGMVVAAARRHAVAGDRVLVLCNRVPHAGALVTSIQASRQRQVFGLDGGAPDAERERTVAAFKDSRRGAVLVCTPFFREGVDVPQVDVGILAGGGASDIATLQALGRMLTARPDKSEVVVYDFADGRDRRAKKDYLAQHFWENRLPLYREQDFIVEGVCEDTNVSVL